MNKTHLLGKKRSRRQRRVRAKIFGSKIRPRLAVFRSNRGMYVQLIDDERKVTVAAVSSKELPGGEQKKPKIEQAKAIGKLIAEKALRLGIKQAVFDRRSYQYHGRVSALAEGVRNGGLTI